MRAKILPFFIALSMMLLGCQNQNASSNPMDDNAVNNNDELYTLSSRSDKEAEQAVVEYVRRMNLSRLRDTQYFDMFVNANGKFRTDRIPQIKFELASSLLNSDHNPDVDAARAEALQNGVPASEVENNLSVLYAKARSGDWWVSPIYVNGVGFIGDIWMSKNFVKHKRATQPSYHFLVTPYAQKVTVSSWQQQKPNSEINSLQWITIDDRKYAAYLNKADGHYKIFIPTLGQEFSDDPSSALTLEVGDSTKTFWIDGRDITFKKVR